MKYLVRYSQEYIGSEWLSVARVYDAKPENENESLACGEYLENEKPTDVDIVHDCTKEYYDAVMADIRADLPF